MESKSYLYKQHKIPQSPNSNDDDVFGKREKISKALEEKEKAASMRADNQLFI